MKHKLFWLGWVLLLTLCSCQPQKQQIVIQQEEIMRILKTNQQNWALIEEKLKDINSMVEEAESIKLEKEKYLDPALQMAILRAEGVKTYGIKESFIPDWVKKRYPKDRWYDITAEITLESFKNQFIFNHRTQFLEELSQKWLKGENKKTKENWRKNVKSIWQIYKGRK